MGLHAHGDRPAIIGEINITPLTDIFLVLLIIMMVVAPMIQQTRADIKLPKIKSGQHVESNQATVEITKDGDLYVQNALVSSIELTNKMKGLLPTLQEKNLVIKADKSTKTGTVLKILESARDAGYEKVTVSGDALTDERQQQLEQQQPQQ